VSRVRTPIRSIGKTTARWIRWRIKNTDIVDKRARGKCEVTGMRGVALERHHLMGRTPEPWASHALCYRAVTVHLHNDLERELQQALHAELRWNALKDLAAEFDALSWFLMTNRIGETAMDAWRRLTQYLDDQWEFDADRVAIVRRAA
jgi:hypothetical protein